MKHHNNNISPMLSEIYKLYIAAKQTENKRIEQGETFNIFNILGLRSEEVRLHSALIAELLNPKGRHGCASLFLKSFLKTIEVDNDYINFEKCSSNIKERVIGPKTENEGGRVDIIIEDGNHAIIIENKIYAKDQEKQMFRYYNYGKKNFSKGFKLVYLTLEGHEPEAFSLGKRDYEYKLISYENDIINWLKDCYEIAKGRVLTQSIITQYCELIKQLTYKDMDTQYKEQLKAVTLAPENVLAVGEILKIQEEWVNGLYEEYIWKPIKEFAISKGMNFNNACTYGQSGAWIYKNEWKYYAIFVWTDSNKYWNNMHVGVSWYEQPNRNTTIYKKNYVRLNCLDNEPKSDWPYGWEYLRVDIRDWGYYITEKIVRGEVFDYIKKKFEEILLEIEERKLPMH